MDLRALAKQTMCRTWKIDPSRPWVVLGEGCRDNVHCESTITFLLGHTDDEFSRRIGHALSVGAIAHRHHLADCVFGFRHASTRSSSARTAAIEISPAT